MELFAANRQWSTRPADERFESIEDLYAATRSYAANAFERENVALSTLKADVDGDNVVLVGKGGTPARLTHWSFGQLAAKVSAPASYLRLLPAQLAVENLQHGLALRNAEEPDATVNLLLHRNGAFVVRALTSDRYERIWNYEVAERLLALKARGWDVATPDIRYKEGPGQKPLYASDHDMFAFVRSQQRVAEPGNPDGLQRGVMVANSEVGGGSLQLTRFLYREMCGNHIIWGAKDVTELRLRHVGNVRDRMQLWDAEVKRYLDSSASDEEATIASAATRRIGATKADVLDAVFGLKIPGLTRTVITAGYEAVVPEQDGDPRTTWGLVQGITRHSQTIGFADARTAIDKAAGKLLEEAF